MRLVPALDPDRCKGKACQTEADWLESSKSGVSIGQIDEQRAKEERDARAKMKELSRKLEVQKATLAKVKSLIESKGSSG